MEGNFFRSSGGHHMATTLLKRGSSDADGVESVRALRDAGVSVVEIDDWSEAPDVLRECEAALVVCEGEAGAMGRVHDAILALRGDDPNGLPRETARKLSHELRTPLSAMAGWIHLLESGKLDAEGTVRALAKLRANIEEQVRTIERYLGATTKEGRTQ